jgi:hypothetical protein
MNFMATILLLHHPFDNFFVSKEGIGAAHSPFLITDVLQVLEQRGHQIEYRNRARWLPHADMVILHTNTTRTPNKFLHAARKFPVNINGSVADISKRAISDHLLTRDSAWDGPVIVKSDLNYGGRPEEQINRRAQEAFRMAPFPGVTDKRRYTVYDTLSNAPEAVWADHDLVVEKFLPEVLPDGYAMRTYIFAGTAERATLHVAKEPIIKGKGIFRSEQAEVPDELRAIRRRLGFDFGKFDYVVRDGRPILLDANKTPSGRRATGPLAKRIKAGNAQLADGLEAYLP